MLKKFLFFKATCNFYEHSERGYTCGLTATVTFNHQENVDVIIEGTHLTGKSDDDVVFIIPENALLDFLPPSIIRKFKNFEQVDFSNVGLKLLPAQTLNLAVKLRNIYLQDNHISALPENAFNKTQANYIELRNNVISDLAWNAFAGLTNLDFLQLHRNKIHGSLDSRMFQDLINIRTIHLSFNQITDIPVDTFKNCAKLEYISLGSNRIYSLKSEPFKPLVSLTKLHLYDNGIRYIERNFFDTLQNVREFWFRQNVCADFDVYVEADVNLEIVSRLDQCFVEEVQLCLTMCSIADEF